MTGDDRRRGAAAGDDGTPSAERHDGTRRESKRHTRRPRPTTGDGGGRREMFRYPQGHIPTLTKTVDNSFKIHAYFYHYLPGSVISLRGA